MASGAPAREATVLEWLIQLGADPGIAAERLMRELDAVRQGTMASAALRAVVEGKGVVVHVGDPEDRARSYNDGYREASAQVAELVAVLDAAHELLHTGDDDTATWDALDEAVHTLEPDEAPDTARIRADKARQRTVGRILDGLADRLRTAPVEAGRTSFVLAVLDVRAGGFAPDRAVEWVIAAALGDLWPLAEGAAGQPRMPSAVLAPEASVTPTAAQVLGWMKSRPGASWKASTRDVERAIEALTSKNGA